MASTMAGASFTPTSPRGLQERLPGLAKQLRREGPVFIPGDSNENWEICGLSCDQYVLVIVDGHQWTSVLDGPQLIPYCFIIIAIKRINRRNPNALAG